VENKRDYIAKLQVAVSQLHNCGATWRETVPIHEVFQGKTAWQGDVEVFDLTGHPKAKRAYARSHLAGAKDERTRFCCRSGNTTCGFGKASGSGSDSERCERTKMKTVACLFSALVISYFGSYVVLRITGFMRIWDYGTANPFLNIEGHEAMDRVCHIYNPLMRLEWHHSNIHDSLDSN
jgi:hypothetical protein